MTSIPSASVGRFKTKPELARRAGVAARAPYYAGYSESFVADALVELGYPRVVLDPWNGAGTTTAVAAGRGSDVYGLDTNPAAHLLASARQAHQQDVAHASGLVAQMLQRATRLENVASPQDPLGAWLGSSTVHEFRAISHQIITVLGRHHDGRLVDPLRAPMPPFLAFLYFCLIEAARKLARPQRTSNPVWVRPSARRRIKAGTLSELFAKTVTAVAREQGGAAIGGTGAVTLLLADARHIPLTSESVDAVIGSPPYCTRLDYAVATRFELAALGLSEASLEFRSLRQGAIGTTLAREALSHCVLPASTAGLLEAIRTHPSKASGGYYFKYYQQYFADVNACLAETHRVLRPRGKMVIVVQSSYYKEIRIDLAQLFSAAGTMNGFSAEVIARNPVRKFLGQINRNSAKYVSKKEYTEDVVVLTKQGNCSLELDASAQLGLHPARGGPLATRHD